MVSSAVSPQEADLVRRTDKKGRRLWKSFSVEASQARQGEEMVSSEGAAVKEVSWSSQYGCVVPAIRYQLAEQDNIEAQLSLARELLVRAQVAGLDQEEVDQAEERAVYWLLRAAQQGDTEAGQTIRALAGQGRGVTDSNYLDVLNITEMSPDTVQAGYLGRKIFRSLSDGQDFVTTVQISRLVEPGLALPTTRLGQAKYSQEDLVEASSLYLAGDVPAVRPVLTSPVLALLTSRISIIFLSLLLYLGEVSSLQVSLWTTWRTFSSLSVLTALSLSTLHTRLNQGNFRAWANILQVFSDKVETEKAEQKYLTRHNLTPLLLTASLLSLPGYAQSLLLQDEERPLVWSFWFLALIGSTSSALSLPRVSKSFLAFLLLSLSLSLSLASWSSSLESLTTDWLPAQCQVSPSQLPGLLSLGYFLPRLVLQPPVTVLLELQALVWESLLITGLTGRQPSSLLLYISPLLVVMVVMREWKILTWRQVLLCSSCLLLAGVSQCSLPHLSPSPRPASSLTWLTYSEVCRGSSGRLTTDLTTTCQDFTGLGVQWSGQVTRLHISQRTNTLETFLDFIPDTIRDWSNVDCVLGTRSDIYIIISHSKVLFL